jgi:hypothetical protein
MSTESAARARLGGGLGLLSLATLAASIVWVHHWSARSDAIVTVWSLSTLGALGVSCWALETSSGPRRWARLGVTLAAVSLLALVLAGIAWAAGVSVSGACGGG